MESRTGGRHNSRAVKPGYWEFEREVADWHFWFRTRRRILRALLERAGIRPGGRILDVGCGAGTNAPVLAPFGRVYALDREPVALASVHDRPYAGRVRAAAERLPFRSGAFDAVVALDLLEHLDDDRAGARELARVLAPGGLLCVFVPAFRSLWGYNDDLSEHRRRYRRRELEGVIASAGLDVELASYINVALSAPLLVTRRLTAWLGLRSRYEHQLKPGRLDAVLGALFGAEVPLLERGVTFPVGVSIACVARRREAS